jgi:1-acyl-sn-glycerol-3-phosphate acyltransferase
MNYLRTTRNWTHVAGRAVVYGTVSVVGGTVTRSRRVGQWCMRSWCQGSLDGLGIQRELIHGERLEPVRQCIYVSNHLSQLDILVLGSYLPGDYRWLAKSSLFKIPFLGWHLTLSGHVPVYRGEQRDKNAALAARIHRVVEQGASILFFPEGTRSRDGNLKGFRLGAFMAAVRESLPIVPLVVRGTHELFVPGSRDLAVRADRSCSVTVLPAIELPTEGEEKKRASELLARTHAIFEEELARG